MMTAADQVVASFPVGLSVRTAHDILDAALAPMVDTHQGRVRKDTA